ncbi:MAG: hypothetical protein FJ253_07820 [Phycisphaerae bacterium]|nr:hypothetical protein [Phycisphaerae bacterium]
MPTPHHRSRRGDGLTRGGNPRRGAAIIATLCLAATVPVTALGGCQSNASQSKSAPSFKHAVDRAMPKFGEGNMIVIADAAFPALSHDGMDTVPMAVGSIQGLRDVIASASSYGHVKPIIWVDRELMLVTDSQAPGIEQFRSRLRDAAGNIPIDSSLSQAQLRERIQSVADTHRVIVIKTPNRLPFSSIYVEFDHGSWTPEQNAQLQSQMAR